MIDRLEFHGTQDPELKAVSFAVLIKCLVLLLDGLLEIYSDIWKCHCLRTADNHEWSQHPKALQSIADT
jgi:hypothetical protein